MYKNKYNALDGPPLHVRLFRSRSGAEPVRDWLCEMKKTIRKAIGEDIKTVQIGWPLGMPLVRKMEKDLGEDRSPIPGGMTRVLFTLRDNQIVLLHGFVKKSPKTPADDLEIARRRLCEL